MDFNSSYYNIIVFSQQLFVDTILRLQDLSVQSQEMAHHSFIIIWFYLQTNAILFAFGDWEWSADLIHSHRIQWNQQWILQARLIS